MGQTDRPDDRRAAGSRLSSNRESAVKGITKRRNPESQNAKKPRPAPGFLAKSNTCSGQITAMFQSLPNYSRPTTYSASARFALGETAFGTEPAGSATSRPASGRGASLATVSAATGATFISPSRARTSAVSPG